MVQKKSKNEITFKHGSSKKIPSPKNNPTTTVRGLKEAGIISKNSNKVKYNENNNATSFQKKDSKTIKLEKNKVIIEKPKRNIKKDSSKNKPNPGTGLKNLNNVDYIYSTLQCLANNTKISDFFNSHIDFFRSNNISYPMSYCISRIIIDLNLKYNNGKTNKEACVSPILEELTTLNPSFRGNSSKDPIEFLIFLFSLLDNELKSLDKTNNDNDNIIKDLFSWVNKKEKHCPDCQDYKEKQYITQYFYTFDLDFKKTQKKIISIKDCLNNYSKEKQIFNNYCINCKRKKMIMNYISSIEKLPKIFVFVIKDLVNAEEKIVIEFEKKLRIKNMNYELKNIVAFDKKYFAYCHSFYDGKWYICKNEEIKPINPEEVIRIDQGKIKPVIFFYESIS